MGLPIDDENAPLYTVGQAAEMLDVQPAYLRRLDEYDVVRPARSAGGQRRYSRRQIHLVQRISGLADEGIGLAGVRRVLALEAQVAALESERDAAVEDARMARLAQRSKTRPAESRRRI